MKKTKFQRLTAFALALIMVFGGTLAVSAADSSSAPGTTTSDIKEILNAISYNDYISNNAAVPKATQSIVLNAFEGWDYVTKNGEKPAADADGAKVTDEYEGRLGLYVPSTGTVTWTTDKITAAARYNIVIEYYPVVNKATSIERILMVNGDIPFAEARGLSLSKIWKTGEPYYDVEVAPEDDLTARIQEAANNGVEAYRTEKSVDGATKYYLRYVMPELWTEANVSFISSIGARFFTTDMDKNEIRSSLVQAPEWTTYTFEDSNGFMQEPFEVVLAPDSEGKVSISLKSVNEPIAISAIRLEAPTQKLTYADYLAQHSGKPEGNGVLKIEGEYFSNASSQTIYPVSDGTSAITSPTATDRTMLNVVGGDKWQSAGQWIEYSFSVSESGMYQIVPRFKQSILDGMYTSRMLHIYSSDGYYNGLPFEEAGQLKFQFSSDWQSGPISDGVNKFKFYFESGVTYTLRIEVSLGKMGDIVRRVQACLNSINEDYLNILKLTGSNPDELRDYGFSAVMPDTKVDMIIQSNELKAISAELAAEASVKSSMTATLDKVARLLEQMGKYDDEVAKNLEQLKTYIGSLGTWLSDAKTQPLVIDYINVQPEAAELPAAKAGFFKAIIHEIKGFFQSFFRNYDRMGAMSDTTTNDTVEVWLAYGRDQSQVIRELINNDFTPNQKTPVNLKLVAAGTLLPSILSGQGPDVYIGLAHSDVINYAIRGALESLENMEGYQEARSDFNDSAMFLLEIADAQGVMHSYGLPETQSFNMMFVREDILAELNIEIPKTWDDVKEVIPVLQANNMQIGMHNDSSIFLYQSGGELFADDGMRVNLDSNVALEAFTTMCDLFTMYSFPYQYDFANRFRTGEMPIGFTGYTTTYNQLKVFATEIEGLWSFYPMPGYSDEHGNINNVSVSQVTAVVMITGCENKEGAWNFMRWYVDDTCQINYSNEMVAILGPSAKQASANGSALESMPWTADEYEQLSYQFNNLAAIPAYPGSYIIARYTQFAFLEAYNDNKDPAKALESYVKLINKEITRKREEFGLETLELGQTLAKKRLAQAEEELKNVKNSSSYNNIYDTTYNNIMHLIDGYETEDYSSIRGLASTLEELSHKKQNNAFDTAIKYLRDAANALEKYEASK